jgi:alpha-tubulin suppressor-like RCC1 family protein
MKITLHKSLLCLFVMSLNVFNGYAQTSCTNATLWSWVTTPTQIGIDNTWKQISSGDNQTIAILKTDGSLWRVENVNNALKISGTSGFDQISCGANHNLAIKANGSLWAWGGNAVGELGDGTNVAKDNPTQIGTGTNWQQISGGSFHSAAIKTDGSLWTWGQNGFGELGHGATGNKNTPTRVGTGTNWKQVSAGNACTIALKTDGSLWAWGANFSGQLGDGSAPGISGKNTPIQIGTDKNWKQISESHNASCLAIKTDGSLWAWGENGLGKLGDGTNVEKNSPVQVGTAKDWSQVTAGSFHSVGIKNDGSLWAWGYNLFGQLADGTTVDKNSPIRVGNETGWRQASLNLYATTALKCSDVNFIFDPTTCYRIINKASGKALEVKNASQADGAQIYQATANSATNQLWQIIKTTDGKYNFVSKSSGKLMDIVDNSPAGYCADGTIIQQFTADGTNSQKWRLEFQAANTFKIYNETCNKPLRVEGGSTADGASVGIKTDFFTNAFIWTIEEVPCLTSVPIDPKKCYQIINKATNKALEIKTTDPKEGAQIYQWSTDKNRSRLQQIWQIGLYINTTDVYGFVSNYSGKLMDAPDCAEGGLIRQFMGDKTDSQKWKIELQSDGYFKIYNVSCQRYLRVEGGSTADGANVGIKNDFGTDAFKWSFKETVCEPSPIGASLSPQTFGFEARASEGRAKLQWITNTGFKTDYFEIERLNANGSFEVLNRVNTEGGTDLKSYTFTDNDPLDGDNFYRINAIPNAKGTPQYSEVKKVSFSKNDGISIFPNPADDYINVDLRKYEGQTVALSFYNSVGLMVKKQTIEKASAAPQRVDMQGFGAGSYLVRVQSEGKREVTRLFNITK